MFALLHSSLESLSSSPSSYSCFRPILLFLFFDSFSTEISSIKHTLTSILATEDMKRKNHMKQIPSSSSSSSPFILLFSSVNDAVAGYSLLPLTFSFSFCLILFSVCRMLSFPWIIFGCILLPCYSFSSSLSLSLCYPSVWTGTPPRIDGNSIKYERLEATTGDLPPKPFSFLNDKVWIQVKADDDDDDGIK